MLLGSGLEVIAFQRTRPVFKLLTAEIQSLMDKAVADKVTKITQQTLDESKISTILSAASGFLNIKLVPDDSVLNAYTTAITLSSNHVFNDKMWRKYVGNADAYNLYRQVNNVLVGQIDLEAGKVGGDFAKIPLVIGVGHGFFDPKWGFTAEEIAGILLHELGHDFTYCYALHYTCTTNMVLGNAVKAIVAAKDMKQKHAIMSDIENTLGIKIDDKDELTRYDKYEHYYITMLGKYREKVYDALGSSSYNTNMSEQMADMFAARHGAGVAMVSGLHRFHKLVAAQPKESKALSRLCSIMGFVMFFPITIPLMIAGFMANDFIAGTYDLDKDRFIRVRNESYASLKDPELTADEKKLILAEIDVINKIISEADNVWTTSDKLAVLIRASQRNQLRQKRLQQDLEALTNNPLYALAAQYSL
jgi:hypothetical protein